MRIWIVINGGETRELQWQNKASVELERFFMDVPTDPNLGRVIRGYRLEKVLGAGKLTTLYHAYTEELWLPPELTIMLLHVPITLSGYARKQFTERFILESERLIKLRHPSLYPLFGYGNDAGQLYLIFPSPASGTTLANRFQEQKRWSLSEIFSILAPLCSVFDYIHHQGLVYQFFTPINVLLQEHAAPQITGTGLLQLLLLQGLDDDIYKDETSRHLKSIANDYVGMATYLAPEAAAGEPVDRRADIYSLGIILFELLSGKPPFIGGTYMDVARKHIREPLPALHTIAPDIPIALELVINRALHRNPKQRFATAGELVTAFSYVLNERLRAPAYLSNELTAEHIQVEPLPASVNARHYAEPSPLQIEAWHGKENEADRSAHSSTELSISSTNDETGSSHDVSFDTSLSTEHSPQNDMARMAQHIRHIRQIIQEEYSK